MSDSRRAPMKRAGNPMVIIESPAQCQSSLVGVSGQRNGTATLFPRSRSRRRRSRWAPAPGPLMPQPAPHRVGSRASPDWWMVPRLLPSPEPRTGSGRTAGIPATPGRRGTTPPRPAPAPARPARTSPPCWGPAGGRGRGTGIRPSGTAACPGATGCSSRRAAADKVAARTARSRPPKVPGSGCLRTYSSPGRPSVRSVERFASWAHQHRARPVGHVGVVRHVDQQVIGHRVRLDPRVEHRHDHVGRESGGVLAFAGEELDGELGRVHGKESFHLGRMSPPVAAAVRPLKSRQER